MNGPLAHFFLKLFHENEEGPENASILFSYLDCGITEKICLKVAQLEDNRGVI